MMRCCSPASPRHGALSENALLALLARAGFYGRQTAHGFRAAFSTRAHEAAEAHPDIIEACLAHAAQGVRANTTDRSTSSNARAAAGLGRPADDVGHEAAS
ncbi:MAG: hypothetical protein IPJ62_11725 [Betaproteobacteria bacterium]|nr:hypothetical protein [Betaproteobacteria bacterium]